MNFTWISVGEESDSACSVYRFLNEKRQFETNSARRLLALNAQRTQVFQVFLRSYSHSD